MATSKAAKKSNVTSIGNYLPLPDAPEKRSKTFNKKLQKASIKEVRASLADASRICAKTWISVGKGLAERKEKMSLQEFKALCATNAEERKDPHKYPFSYTTAKYLIQLGKIEVTIGDLEKLPPSWTTLVFLSRLKKQQLEKYIESGAVYNSMTRAEATKLVTTKKPKKPEKPAAEKLYDSIIRIGSGMKSAGLVRVFANVIRDLGIEEQMRRALSE